METRRFQPLWFRQLPAVLQLAPFVKGFNEPVGTFSEPPEQLQKRLSLAAPALA